MSSNYYLNLCMTIIKVLSSKTPLPHFAPYKKFEIRNKINSQTMSRHALNTYKYIGQVYYGCEIVNIALTLLVEILAYLQTYKIFHSSN